MKDSPTNSVVPANPPAGGDGKSNGNGDSHAADNAAAHGHEDVLPRDLPRVSTAVVAGVIFVFILLLAALFAIGYFPHRQRIEEADAIAASHDGRPRVDVIAPRRPATAADLVLPADVRAMQETSVFPRANGYLKKLSVDIGDRVTAGQLLAEIDTPEVDAQLAEARAALQQSKANVAKAEADLEFAKTTLARFESLENSDSVTKQDIDEKRSNFGQATAARDATKASVGAAEATVQRLTEMQSFEKVTAPFAGVITARNYDVGALLNPANTGDGKELFKIAQTDTLRVFASVPQTYASQITSNQPATLEVRNFPGKLFNGKVTRNAGAIDPSTRTLRVQVDVPNRDNVLFAGMYGELRFNLNVGDRPALLVPTSAMLFRSDGTKVAVVEDGKVRYKKIVVGRDLGTELEATNGLNGDEQVITNPGEKLADGVEVEIVTPQNKAQPAPPKEARAER